MAGTIIKMSSSLALSQAPPSQVEEEEEAQAEKAACVYLATHVDPLLTKILTELLLHKPQNVLQALLNFFEERQGQGAQQQLYRQQQQQQQQQHYGMPASSYDGVCNDKAVSADWLAQLSSVQAKQGAASVNRWYAVHHVLPILSRLVRHLVLEQPTTEAALDDSVVTFLIQYQQQQQQERDGDQDGIEIEKQKQPQQQDPVKEAATPSSSSFSLKVIHVLVLGLEGAGKSSVVAALQGELNPQVHPTSGMNVTSITSGSSNNSVVKFHDVGGSTASQAQWPTFYHNVHALLWVTDATQATHWKEEREVLRNCLEHPFLAGKPCLLLVNKQDTPLPHYSSARIYQEVAPCFATAEDARGLLRVEGCIANATQNYGILDSFLEVGLTWLLEVATKHAAALKARVEEEEGRAKANNNEQECCS